MKLQPPSPIPVPTESRQVEMEMGTSELGMFDLDQGEKSLVLSRLLKKMCAEGMLKKHEFIRKDVQDKA